MRPIFWLGDRGRLITLVIFRTREPTLCRAPYDVSYCGKWLMGPEKAAYLGGCQSLPEPPKERYALEDDTTIAPFHQPGSAIDPLTEIARDGAPQMLAAALKAEAATFVAWLAQERLPAVQQCAVHHGAGPERSIQTGIGPIPVPRQKVRDQSAAVPPESRIRFSSNILPKCARRSLRLHARLPVLRLRGISTGDVQEALGALVGPDAPNLLPRRDLAADRRAASRP